MYIRWTVHELLPLGTSSSHIRAAVGMSRDTPPNPWAVSSVNDLQVLYLYMRVLVTVPAAARKDQAPRQDEHEREKVTV